MTAPSESFPPPGRKRRWLIAVAVVWGVVLAGLAVWSVRHERATVPEQRTIEQARPELEAATGALFAAADGPGRAVELGPLVYSDPCRVTPVRDGVEATRDVTVQLRAGEARAVLDAIRAELPGSWTTNVAVSRGRTRISFHADAGNFIGIDADVVAAAPAVTLQVSTGCRPLGSGGLSRSEPAMGAPPAVLDAVLRALGASGGPENRNGGVVCPSGRVAGTYTAPDLPAPADLPSRLRFLDTTQVVRADDDVRAYRTGNDSVVVVMGDNTVRVSVSTAC